MVTFPNDALTALVKDAFAEINRVEVVQDALRITTQCLYPSNGLVRVYVRLNATTATVSDDRGALNEVQSAGLDISVKDRSLAHLVTPYGLAISNGTIFAANVSLDAIAGTSILVANASKSVADWMYSHLRVRRNRDFKALLANLLERNFDPILHRNVEIAGLNKFHQFANVLSFPGGRRLLIDPVGNEPASYNSRIIANLDVKALQDRSIDQRIVYDDEEHWPADNLNLLSMGAIAVPFSRSQEVLKRLVNS
jgi:hypothetical protein